MSEHTKGEWEVSLKRAEITGDRYITADNDLTVLATVHNLASMEDSTFRHEAEANAELIANAPETLEQRDELLKQVDLLTLGLLQEKTRTCKWQYVDGAAYQTQCGKRLCKSNYDYCHNCGGKIEQVEEK